MIIISLQFTLRRCFSIGNGYVMQNVFVCHSWQLIEIPNPDFYQCFFFCIGSGAFVLPQIQIIGFIIGHSGRLGTSSLYRFRIELLSIIYGNLSASCQRLFAVSTFLRHISVLIPIRPSTYIPTYIHVVSTIYHYANCEINHLINE